MKNLDIDSLQVIGEWEIWESKCFRYCLNHDNNDCIFCFNKNRGNFNLKFSKKNLITKKYLDTIIKRNLGTANASQTLEFRHLAVGTGTSPANINNIKLESEKARVVFSDSTSGVNFVKMFAVFTTNDGNCNTGIISTSISTTEFQLQTGEGLFFNIGDKIRVEGTLGYENKIIQNIVEDTITLTTPLSEMPIVGNTIDQLWNEMGIYGNGTSTGMKDTGDLFNRVVEINEYKSSEMVFLVSCKITYKNG